MATIRIDGGEFEVKQGENLLHTCLGLGLNLPYFCWHPALGSVGACRQCAVKEFKDDKDTRGKIVMACMTAVADGMRISLEDPDARDFRARTIEWLMLNHPHDCPVCDEGGECHLQDMTVMTGHAYRRTRFPKRTYRNQDLGPFINHEMNRCIQCYRCVRFYRDYAGGEDLDVFASHDHVYFGRHEDGVLENEFSGNLVEVCPTGVFTDKTLKRHYVRKWDLQMAPSVCVHCGLGCNTSPGERSGMLRRMVNRYHGEINGYFLCDRGRFGYEFVNDERRLRRPLVRGAAGQAEVDRGRELDGGPELDADAALRQAAERLASCDRIVGIGSGRASLEANYALRTLVGEEHHYVATSGQRLRRARLALDVLAAGPGRIASLRDVEAADAILVLGEDLTNTAPRAALAVRRAVERARVAFVDSLKIPRWDDAAVRNALQDRRGDLFVATPAATKLDPIATATVRGTPEEIARLGFAVARLLDSAAAAPAARAADPPGEGDVEGGEEPARRIARALGEAERPLVVAGTSLESGALLQAAANMRRALGERGSALLVVPEANTVGVTLLGGRSLEDAVEELDGAERLGLVVVEADLERADPAAAQELLGRAAVVVVIDHLRTATVERATVALPAATFAEASGTLVNNEGRAQRYIEVMPAAAPVRAAWRWLQDLAVAGGRLAEPAWTELDDVLHALGEAEPALAAAADAAPPARFRLVGQKVPRQPSRHSGRTALHAAEDVREPRPPADPDSALAFSMEGFGGQPPPALIPFFWTPGWNSIQAVNAFQREIGGPLRGGDPGVRLIAPDPARALPCLEAAPPARPRRAGQVLLLPASHIFGSEELSALAPGIARLAPLPYLALHPEDAGRAGLGEGSTAELTVHGAVLKLPVVLRPDLKAGTALVPQGVAGVPALELPAVVDLAGRTTS